MAPPLSWRQEIILELLGITTGVSAATLSALMPDRPPCASIRHDIGVLRSKGYAITLDQQTGLYTSGGRSAR